MASPPEIGEVLADAAAYLPQKHLPEIRNAYEFAFSQHKGQLRESGHPYITHPLAVAQIVTSLELDHSAITAALLHDVQEDCDVSNKEIAELFGDDVASLVEGLTKLDNLPAHFGDNPDSQDAVQAQNYRKIFLAMAEDIRVVLVKLCDRLHNMRTLDPLPPEKQIRIARETMEIYAPLANRLGIWQLKWELEDLAFRYLYPERYQEIAKRLELTRDAREKYIAECGRVLTDRLEIEEVSAVVSGRAKHIFSVHEKLERYGQDAKSFNDIYDILALRVIAPTVADCYQVLGIVHSAWRPLPGQFDDYIASPTDRMYQSLHTTVVTETGRPLEVQIRTEEMHRVAEYGVAAHWRYKEGVDQQSKDEDRISWLRQLLEWQRDFSGDEDFVESVKTDIFDDQVFVFTPKGDVIDLPVGATPLDFAYRIHTDLGHQTVGAKVNAKMIALSTELKNGDVVEIMRSRSSRGPSRDWLSEHLDYLHTSHAKQKVRQWFRKQERVESVARGREALDRAMRRLSIELSEHKEELIKSYKGRSWDDLLAAIGYGDISVESVSHKITLLVHENELGDGSNWKIPISKKLDVVDEGSHNLRVLGQEGLETRIASCCNPVPGDHVLGYITRGRGISVHRSDCGNVYSSLGREKERLIDVQWGDGGNQLYRSLVQIEGWDRVGLLRDISTMVAAENVNMIDVTTDAHGDGTVTIFATLHTTGLPQLARLLQRLETIGAISSVKRFIGS
ncbi:MAG: RelA/SpoT family protein [Tepidiformaceae bacterium]